jgi:hypothetical protein
LAGFSTFSVVGSFFFPKLGSPAFLAGFSTPSVVGSVFLVKVGSPGLFAGTFGSSSFFATGVLATGGVGVTDFLLSTLGIAGSVT